MTTKMLIMTLLCAWGATQAQALSFLIDIQQRQSPITAGRRSLYLDSPATMWHLDTLSLARFSAGIDCCHAQPPYVEQEGGGYTALSIETEAYKRISAKSVAWGGAWYSSAVRRDVRWADCIDYDYVAPYVLGDEKGGDLRSNCYRFRGGIATMAAEWTFGAQIDYRAEIAYRDVDPRIKSIVSDLCASVGISRPISHLWRLGASASLSRYDQNCDIDFYNPINDIVCFPMTGLGSWYQRFVGNTNKGSGHEAIGWSAGIQAINLKSGGISAAYQGYKMRLRLRGFNNLILGYTDNDIFTANACYACRHGSSIILMPAVTFALRHRRGTENLFGPALGSSYDKIGSVPNYHQSRLYVRGRCHLQVNTGNYSLTITPGIAYLSDNESLTEPKIEQRRHKTETSIDVVVSKATGKWMWQASAGSAAAAHKPAGSATLCAGLLAGNFVIQAEARWRGYYRYSNAFASISLIF